MALTEPDEIVIHVTIPGSGLDRHNFFQGARQIDYAMEEAHAAALNGDQRRSKKSSYRPLRLHQRLAPETVQCLPDRVRRVPMATLHPASRTPVEVQ